jgi:glutathione S-transferase
LQRLPSFFANLDAQLEGREFLVGNSLSQADIDAYVTVNFSGWVKVQPDAELKQLAAWKERVAALVEAPA